MSPQSCLVFYRFFSRLLFRKIFASGQTSKSEKSCAVYHCDRLMSWRVPQQEHEFVSETGVFPSLDHVSGTLCLSQYVTETSHLHSLRDFWRHFGLCRAAAHSDCCFFAPCTNILTYLLMCKRYFINSCRSYQPWEEQGGGLLWMTSTSPGIRGTW